MTAKTINLQEWEPFGGGGFGESYYNKTDDSVILKLNKPGIPPEKSLEEFQRSKAVFDMGIPCAQPYDYVTDGERYGMIVQRIQGKESFGRIIADHPERLPELAGITAACAKALHAIPCDTRTFDSVPMRARNLIADSTKLPDDIKTRLLGYINQLEPVTTCLHGDLNPCNIITARGKYYWIDLGDFGYGDPLFDFNNMAHMSHLVPSPMLKQVFHIDRKTLYRFYTSVCKQYFGDRWGTPDLQEKLDHIIQIMAGKVICLFPQAAHINLPYLRGRKFQTVLNLFLGDRLQKVALSH